MANSSLFIISSLLMTIALVVSSSHTVFEASEDYHLPRWSWVAAKPVCDGPIVECTAAGEFEMDSEINRRILAMTKYISYEALKRNTVPCSRKGQSYYNCKPVAEVNPYNRGCSAITRCRS